MKGTWIHWVHDRWVIASVGVTAAVVVAGAVAGFAWLPLEQPGAGFRSLWDAICSAAGFIQIPPVGEQVVQPDYPTTRVEVTPQTLRRASAESIGRGATLALRCTMCHGARGLSQADTPNLAGQFPLTIYKQLMDFKTGARTSSVMAPLVAGLSDADMRDLAAYYGYLPHETGAGAGTPPQIVGSGAPMRGIAPCGACHGDLASKAGAAWLEGQPEVYLRTQLEAFASGGRRNDIGAQMRNVARGMTQEDINAASKYYAERP